MEMKKQKVKEWFWDYLNNWCDLSEHRQNSLNNKITEFGKGYKQAVRDIFDKVKK